MYLRTDREVLPVYVVPHDLASPRQKYVASPTKEERATNIGQLQSEMEPSSKQSDIDKLKAKFRAEVKSRWKTIESPPHVNMREETGMIVIAEDPAHNTDFHPKDEPVDIEIKLEPEEATTNLPGYSNIDGVVLHEKQWQEIPDGANQGTGDALIIKQEPTDWPSSPSPVPESNMEPLTSKTLKGGK